VSGALKALLYSGRWHPPATGPQPELLPQTSTTPSASRTHTSPKACQPTPRKRAIWEAVQQRRGLGQSLRQIAPALGLDRRTVRKYLAADQPPVYPTRRPRPTQLTPYLEYLAERWTQGCHNARRLYHEWVPRATGAPRAWSAWSSAPGAHARRVVPSPDGGSALTAAPPA
jgi:hypothetical protein